MTYKKSLDIVRMDKKEDPVYRAHNNNIDIQNNHIYLVGNPDPPSPVEAEGGLQEPGIEYSMASTFIINMHLCLKVNKNDPVVIHMKTCGGDWNEGMGIFDTILCHPTHVTIINYTHARSMSSIIFQIATKRLMMPNSHFMFHQGTYADYGTLKHTKSNLEFYDTETEKMLNIYAWRMKQKGKFSRWSIKKIKDMLQDQMNKKEDVFLSAKDTVEWGLADAIFNGNWESLTTYTTNQENNAVEFASNFFD